MNPKIASIILVAIVSGGWAQATTVSANPISQDPFHRESPRSSVLAFLEACHAGNYAQAAHYLDLRNDPPDQRTKSGPQLAQALGQILDRDVRFDVGSLSGSPEGNPAGGLAVKRERVDSFQLNGQTVELHLEHVTLRSGLSVWLFSSDSVNLVPQLARQLSSSPIERHLPGPLVDWKLMDTPAWRWIALALLGAVLGPLSRLVTRPLLLLAGQVSKRIAPRIDQSTLRPFVGPLQLLLCIGIFHAGIEVIRPAALLRQFLERILALLFFLAIVQLAIATVDAIIRHARTVLESRHQSFAYSAMPLASRVLKITIIMVCIAAVLSAWGYNTTTILAGLGVGGLAVALAAQKTIENLFGGVAVITDRPVAVGDFCRFGSQVGTVEDVGLRSTRIRTLDRTLVTIPNAEFSNMTLENFSKRDKMWFHITLNLRRDTRPGQVRILLESITRALTEHAKVQTGPLPVRFIGVGTYSLDLEVFAYVLTPNFDEFLQVQQELLLWIMDAVQAAETALAVPTQAYLPLNAAGPMPRDGALEAPLVSRETPVA